MEAVLGKGWEVHVEGQKLKQDGEAFRQKLNTQQLFEDWKKKVWKKTGFLAFRRRQRGLLSCWLAF